MHDTHEERSHKAWQKALVHASAIGLNADSKAQTRENNGSLASRGQKPARAKASEEAACDS
jgi:hypothetical protein